MIFDKRKIKSFCKFIEAYLSVIRLNKSRLVCLLISLKKYEKYVKKIQQFCLCFEIIITIGFFPLLSSLTNSVAKLSFVSMSSRYRDSLSVFLCIHAFNKPGRHLEFLIYDVIRGKTSAAIFEF